MFLVEPLAPFKAALEASRCVVGSLEPRASFCSAGLNMSSFHPSKAPTPHEHI